MDTQELTPLNVAQLPLNPPLSASNKHISAGKPVIQPFIELRTPHDFNLPIEMFAKRLINSSIEFGTVSTLIADEARVTAERAAMNPGQRGSLGGEIPVAMHPHYGVMVCNAVWATGGQKLHTQLESVIQIAREDRDVLCALLSDSFYLKRRDVSAGIFIMLMRAEAEQAPEHLDLDGVWFCGASGFGAMPAKICAAMVEAERARPTTSYDSLATAFRGDGPRFIAAVRALRHRSGACYTSGLEILMSYNEI